MLWILQLLSGMVVGGYFAFGIVSMFAMSALEWQLYFQVDRWKVPFIWPYLAFFKKSFK